MTPLKDYSIEQLQEAIQLKREIRRLDSMLEKIGGEGAPSPAPVTVQTHVAAKRKYMTAAKRDSLAKARAARWAKHVSPQKYRITPEVRAKMSLAAKARWIARKAKAKSQATA